MIMIDLLTLCFCTNSDSFYGYGELESVRVLNEKMCAFVTYTTREATEKAAEATFGKLTIKGMPIRVSWGRPQAAMGGTLHLSPLSFSSTGPGITMFNKV
jgi:hypothetical protein